MGLAGMRDNGEEEKTVLTHTRAEKVPTQSGVHILDYRTHGSNYTAKKTGSKEQRASNTRFERAATAPDEGQDNECMERHKGPLVS